jgi:hypothetical protein
MRHLVRDLPLVMGVALGASSCAGTTAGSDEPTVQLVIHNELPSTITAYMQWVGGANTIRLGVIGAHSSETYLPAYRGNALCLWTARFGDTSFSTTVPDRPDLQCGSGMPVERGERLDMFLRPDRTCFLQQYPYC